MCSRNNYVTFIGLTSGTSDREIWEYAKENGFAIVTADNDFLGLEMHSVNRRR
jgi:predicted nuclease of predicted toxin-antitoxin system